MKALNILNIFIVGIPLLLILAGFLFEETLIYYGLWFTLVTGAFQVIVGVGVYVDSGFRHDMARNYLAVVAVFFVLWFIAQWTWLLVLPPALAIYLTVILYIEAKKAAK